MGIRYSYISGRDSSEPYAKFSQPAEKLPNSSLIKMYGLFPQYTPKDQVSYDAVIYDTYDYSDQVLSFSLSDTLIAAFEIYNEQRNDPRALKIIELFRYGTNNSKYILLLRYGFPSEMVREIAQHVSEIDENRILFSPSIDNAPKHIRDFANWYLP